jgi:broad specificity phosphatase PhoE
MLVYIVRHGETEYNKEELFRGRKDVPLNDVGKKQAERLGTYFEGKTVARIFASPLARAQQTAQGISKKANAPVETIEEFTDMDFGAWEGVALKEVERLYPREFLLWKETPQNLKVKDGESLAKVRQRMRKGMERILSGKERDCVIVTHRVLCKLMVLYALNIPNSRFWGMKFDPASVSLIERRGRDMTIYAINDTCHLRVNTDSGEYRDF